MNIGARELVALVLACSVASAMIALAIAAAVAEGSGDLALSEAAASLLSTVLGASIGVLATFVAGNRGDSPKSSSQERP